MKLLALLIVAVGRLNAFVGRSLAWLTLAGVVLCFTVVVQRYVFATTHLWMQDLYVWVNGAMFMGVAGYALLVDAHVRVDIFYRPASVRRKALLDLVGVVLFLLPFCAVIWIWGSDYVYRSWGLREGSANPGGMPGLYVLKTFILVFVILVALQGLSMLSRSILVLAGKQDLIPARFRYQQQE